MIPVWIFAIFIILFAGVIIWERVAYKRLEMEYEIVGNFLDMYITKYGPLPGIMEIGAPKDADNEK